jgi:DNA-binding MarR family transcriptional regulator
MLNLLRRISINKATANIDLYFGQLPIMEYIINNEGCTQKEIADILKVTPASIAISTKRMQKSGLIYKKTDENNLRRNSLFVTEYGRELSQMYREQVDNLDKTVFKGFSNQELLVMKNHLDRMINNISDGNETEVDVYSIAVLVNEVARKRKK